MDCSSLITGDIYRNYIAPSLIPCLLVIGWLVVSRDNDRRETRKEIRALLNDAAKRLDALQGDAISYFCAIDNRERGTARSAEVQLKQDIERLDAILQILAKMEQRFEESRGSFDELADSITGHPKFESPQFSGTLSHDDVALLEVSLQRANMVGILEQTFIDTQVRHKSTWWN